MSLHIVVLAGGSGARLWPLSRIAVPKHLLPIGAGGTTLLRATVERLLPLEAQLHIVTGAAQAQGCTDALEGTGVSREAIIAEPSPRGTGPALGLAVKLIAREDPGAVIASVHADHHIGDDEGYRAALYAAAGWAAATAGLVTVGLTPTHPATGLGYIEAGEQLAAARWQPLAAGHAGTDRRTVEAASRLPAFVASGFVEKPARAVAEAYVAGGHHLWNSGLFAWPASVFEEELRTTAPDLDGTLAAVATALEAGEGELAAAAYEALEPVAIDPLLLERTRRLTVVRAAFGWSDVGSWADLRTARSRAGEGDREGNVVVGDVLLEGSSGCLVEAHGGRLVAVLGARDLCVIDTGDAVLVVPSESSQDVRELVDRLRAGGRLALL